jgi:hypothetical protein
MPAVDALARGLPKGRRIVLPEYDHAYPNAGRRKWEHVCPPDGRSIVVVMSNGSNQVASSVTYGGLALSLRVAASHFSRRTEIWQRDDISGRSSDIVAVAMSGGSNRYLSSTIIRAKRPVAHVATATSTGWAALATTTVTLNGATGKRKAMIFVLGGENAYYSEQYTPYGDSVFLSDAACDNSNGCLTVIRVGPSLASLTAGVVASVAQSGRFRTAILLEW